MRVRVVLAKAALAGAALAGAVLAGAALGRVGLGGAARRRAGRGVPRGLLARKRRGTVGTLPPLGPLLTVCAVVALVQADLRLVRKLVRRQVRRLVVDARTAPVNEEAPGAR